MSEGSVIVDGFDSEVEETADENQESGAESTEETQETAPLQTEESEEPATADSEAKPQLTEKGTKLDPNPQSALHQQLANERRERERMAKVLNDPVLLRKYQEEAGWIKPEPQVPAFTSDNVPNAETVIKALNEMDTKVQVTKAEYEKQITDLKGQLGQLTEGRTIEKNISSLERSASVLREKYPELKPGTPSYSKTLEEKIGAAYKKLDFDERGLPTGRFTLEEVGDMVMEAAYELKKKGSEEAQTIVKDKSLGKVITSSKSGKESANESKDPDTVIAQRISKLFK